jgi:hypothetical protein
MADVKIYLYEIRRKIDRLLKGKITGKEVYNWACYLRRYCFHNYKTLDLERLQLQNNANNLLVQMFRAVSIKSLLVFKARRHLLTTRKLQILRDHHSAPASGLDAYAAVSKGKACDLQALPFALENIASIDRAVFFEPLVAMLNGMPLFCRLRLRVC